MRLCNCPSTSLRSWKSHYPAKLFPQVVKQICLKFDSTTKMHIPLFSPSSCGRLHIICYEHVRNSPLAMPWLAQRYQRSTKINRQHLCFSYPSPWYSKIPLLPVMPKCSFVGLLKIYVRLTATAQCTTTSHNILAVEDRKGQLLSLSLPLSVSPTHSRSVSFGINCKSKT